MIRAGIRLAGIRATVDHTEILGKRSAATQAVGVGKGDGIRPELVRIEIISNDVHTRETPGARRIRQRHPGIVDVYRDLSGIQENGISELADRCVGERPLNLGRWIYRQTDRIGIDTAILVANQNIAGVLHREYIHDRSIADQYQRIAGDRVPLGRITAGRL